MPDSVEMPAPEAPEEDEPVESSVDEDRLAGVAAQESAPAADEAAVAGTLEALRRRGFGRLLVEHRAVAFDDLDVRSLAGRSVLPVVVDRIVIEGDVRGRLTDSVETAYREGGGAAWAVESGSPSRQPAAAVVPVFSERFECRPCGITYEVPQPRRFSFNNPFGACPTCHGFGNIIELDMDLVVPDPSKSIAQNAIEPWSKPHYRTQLADLKRASRRHKIRLDVPWAELTDAEKQFVIEGADDYDGIRGFFRWLERKKYKVHVRVFLSRYRGYLTCHDCGGTRLRREARHVHVGGRTIDVVCALTVSAAAVFPVRVSVKRPVVAPASVAAGSVAEIVTVVRSLGAKGIMSLVSPIPSSRRGRSLRGVSCSALVPRT